MGVGRGQGVTMRCFIVDSSVIKVRAGTAIQSVNQRYTCQASRLFTHDFVRQYSTLISVNR